MKYVFGFLVIYVLLGEAAYPPYIINPVRSAISTSGAVTFQCDYTSASEPGSIRGGKVFLKNISNVVTESVMSMIAPSGDYAYTYEATATISSSNPTDVYFMFYDDTTVATQSFKNTSSTFPPPSYCWGKVLTDPAGDLMNGVTDSKLDITGQWATYSDTGLYFRISHAGGDWNVGGLWPPYFSWACYVINPDAPTDTIYYALLYCKNVGVIAPGLWRFTRSGSYTQIGSIQNQVVNDSLVLSCSMDTLTSDPYFGPWPNPSGYLIVGVRTDKAVSLTSTVQADRTPNQKFYPSTMTIYPTSPNSPPYIWDYTITESKLTYSYIITINYRDDDNNLPTIHKVIVNGAEFDMTTSDHRYDDGAVFSSNVMLGSPIMSLGFRFFDGRDSSNSIYLYAEKDELPNNLLFVKAYPNPFNRAVTIEFTANSIKPVYFRVYDITGKMVDYIEINNIKNGKNTFCYTPSEKISSGIYFYRLEGIQKGGRLIYLK